MRPATRGLCAGLLAAVAACSASGASDETRPPGPDDLDDGGAPVVDGAPDGDAGPEIDPDADRPLVCGDAGFCETKLPASDVGKPLALQGVWSVAPNDVWSVTAEGFVLHYDGTSWKTDYRATYPLTAVWATAAGVWVGGEGGPILHKPAGGAWTFLDIDHGTRVRAISGTSDDDVWFASDDGLVDHYDGTTLSAYPFDVPDLRIMTIAARAGRGVFAAGYVSADPEYVYEPQPFLFELTPAGAVTFNPTLEEYYGFLPVSLEVTDAPDDEQRIFLFGYMDYGEFREVRYARLGPESAVALEDLKQPVKDEPVYGSPFDPEAPYAIWVRSPVDVVMPYAEDFRFAYLYRLNASGHTVGSLGMGSGFVPRRVAGVHGNAVDTWLVGDGFALKGATP
ncbi:MAG: hypothetical protein KF850_16900 [Labilithrix sp.]|nr:hypothetical protein [Labilithrix sp.]